MRLVFAGTPAPAALALEALLDSRHEIVAVLTRPDARTGRGRTLTPSPVAQLATQQGIAVLKPTTLRDAAVQQQLADLAPDCIPVVAYGNLVPKDALEIPRHGWINLHFSLLPQLRGAAPVQRALLDDLPTGLSVFQLEQGLDTGPLFAQLPAESTPTDTSGTLLDRLARDGAQLLVEVLDQIEDGTAVAVPQQAEGSSYAPKLQKPEGQIDWTASADAVDRRIRAFTPDPGAWTVLPAPADGAAETTASTAAPGVRLKLLSTVPAADTRGLDAPEHDLAPGELAATRNALWVGTGAGRLALGTLAPPGRKPMAAADWARGARLAPGTTLLGPPAPATSDTTDTDSKEPR